MNRSKVKVQREEHQYLKKKSPQKMSAVRFDEGRLDGHDCARRIGYDPTRGAHLFLSSLLSDLNRTVGISPRVAPRRPDLAFNPERLILIVDHDASTRLPSRLLIRNESRPSDEATCRFRCRRSLHLNAL